MAKSELLKKAIADAEDIKRISILNAKEKLEEAFLPELASMLEDEDLENEDEYSEEEPEMGGEEEYSEEPSMEPEISPEEIPSEEPTENTVDLDNMEVDTEEGGEDEEFELESIIRELESDEDEFDGDEEFEDEELGEGLEKPNESSEIGKGSEGPGAEGRVSSDLTQSPDIMNKIEEGEEIEDEELDGDFNIEEMIRELMEEDDVEDVSSESPDTGMLENLRVENKKLKSSLLEHRDVIKELKSKLNEINLLNAKLLFTTRLFKSHSLNQSQKMKVVESFDRATSMREVKLIYATLSESMQNVKPSINKKQRKSQKTLKEAINGKASKTILNENKTRKENNPIISSEVAERAQKLAGIKKFKKQ